MLNVLNDIKMHFERVKTKKKFILINYNFTYLFPY